MKLDLSKLSNLNQRIIAGLSGAILIVTCICWSEWSYFILFFLICFFSLREFYGMVKSADIKPNSSYGIFSGLTVFSLLFLVEKGLLSNKLYFLLFPLIFLPFLFELFRNLDKPFFNIAFTFLGNIYVALPFGLINISAFKAGVYDYKIVLGILLILWANDVGAYIFGVLMGKTKLFLRISPKKTWEGTIGGGLFALLTSFGLSYFFNNMDILHWLVLAVIIAVMGSYGDLVESLLKRSLSIKDSAQSIPGHGGFLDRFDGLLFAAPFIAAYLKLFV